MITTDIRLRALETADFPYFYQWENNPDEIGKGNNLQPISGFVIQEFIQNATRPVEDVGQLRLVITSNQNEPLGFIDLFEIDFRQRRAGIGVLIGEVKYRNQDYGTKAVRLMCQYARNVLNLELIFADIRTDNLASIRVFQKAGFHDTVHLPAWDCVAGVRHDCLRTFLKLL
jgi:diamine N-acetyltransferase